MNLEKIIDKGIADSVFPGIDTVIVKKGKKIFETVKGYRQLFPEKAVLHPGTFFDMASLTKSLATAPVALTVFEQENIPLTEEISHFLNDIPEETGSITLLQLLTHTSGLPPVPDIFHLFPSDTLIQDEKIYKHLYALKPVNPPGKNIIYSCTGYIFLSLILKAITGKPLSKLYKEIISEPAKIDGLLFNPLKENISPDKIAATEFCSWRNRWIHGEVHDENSYCLNGEGGNAGLFGTAASVEKYLSMMTAGRIFSPEVRSMMTTLQAEDADEKRTAGFLMQSKSSFAGPFWSTKAFGHTGFTGTSVWIDPEYEITIIVLTNRVHLGREQTADKIKQFRKAFHSAVFKEFC